MSDAIHFRYHRGLLAESMLTAVQVDGWEGLVRHVRATYPKDIEPVATPYGDDDRIGWKNVHLVSAEGFGVIGFCAPVEDLDPDFTGPRPESQSPEEPAA